MMASAYQRSRRLSVRRKALMISCGVAAIATVMVAGASPAAAQSFQGTGVFANGSGTITPGTGTTFIQVDTSQAVINWTPTDNAVGNFGAINFQPVDTIATFNGSGDYAVLNNILVADPNRMIALNGTIQSFTGGEFTGGRIYFYSPSGFVLTGTSVFDVGSLVLSASPITVDGNGNFINNGTVTFGQAPNPNAAITTVSDINGTSQITAPVSGSYVALVAPLVDHQGTINVNGSAALVGAEAATITFSPDGLFNIQIDVGTTDPNGVVVSGDIGGPGSSSADEAHRAYLVAVPKNQALTMLLSGNAGFAPASSATIQNGTIVLAAGSNIAETSGSLVVTSPPGINADLTIGSGTYGSSVRGFARGDI
ncbi:MAG TPA: hypothetical protein VFU80_06520, partial [Sphingomicrobium sp.]|nr:hypothetical protein [Sphingomicrobium sp.]